MKKENFKIPPEINDKSKQISDSIIKIIDQHSEAFQKLADENYHLKKENEELRSAFGELLENVKKVADIPPFGKKRLIRWIHSVLKTQDE